MCRPKPVPGNADPAPRSTIHQALLSAGSVCEKLESVLPAPSVALAATYSELEGNSELCHAGLADFAAGHQRLDLPKHFIVAAGDFRKPQH